MALLFHNKGAMNAPRHKATAPIENAESSVAVEEPPTETSTVADDSTRFRFALSTGLLDQSSSLDGLSLSIPHHRKLTAAIQQMISISLYDHQREGLESALIDATKRGLIDEHSQLTCAEVCGRGHSAVAVRLELENFESYGDGPEPNPRAIALVVRLPREFAFHPDHHTTLSESRFAQETISSHENYTLSRYVPGQKLTSLLRSLNHPPKDLTPGDIDDLRLLLARSALRAVSATQHAGVSHGDLKPDNMLVQPNGRVMLIDGEFATHFSELKPSERVSGTVPYLAPEQALGKRSENSDTFSLGSTLYQVLTGDPQTPLQRLLGKDLTMTSHLAFVPTISDDEIKLVIQRSSLNEQVDLRELVYGMLRRNHNARIPLSEAKEWMDEIYREHCPMIASNWAEARRLVEDRYRSLGALSAHNSSRTEAAA